MTTLNTEIINIILEPKKEALINGLLSVLNGKENSYVPEIANPDFYEIWFYKSFDFKYIILGAKNYVVEVSQKEDYNSLKEIVEKHNLSMELDEEKINSILLELEFDFFSKCWTEVEHILNKKIRCFLIENAILRGWDVNKEKIVDGEIIGDILNEEGITNNY
ncbi:hypothetical protein [Dokdonia sp. Asnod3-C12]|uniref:hypothetical protein n=1 Tax=Dokdonia sp. Asnod3-C12 TaxID=3160575 RepID=UPI003870CF46